MVIGVFFEGGYVTEMSWRARVNELQEKIKQPEIKSAVVEYGGKNYIVEGTMEDGYSVFFQAKGEKGKPVTDSSLKNKVSF